jgi:hypothetical protein
MTRGAIKIYFLALPVFDVPTCCVRNTLGGGILIAISLLEFVRIKTGMDYNLRGMLMG